MSKHRTHRIHHRPSHISLPPRRGSLLPAFLGLVVGWGLGIIAFALFGSWLWADDFMRLLS